MLSKDGDYKSPLFDDNCQGSTLKHVVQGVEGVVKEIEFTVDENTNVHGQEKQTTQEDGPMKQSVVVNVEKKSMVETRVRWKESQDEQWNRW